MSKTVAAVIAADCHLDSLIWSKRPHIRGDAFFGLEQAVSLAIKHAVPLILAGDNIECQPNNYPASETIVFLRKQLKRLQGAGLEVFWIDGQHDDHPSWIEAASDMRNCMDGLVSGFKGVRVGFLSYRRTPRLPAAIELANTMDCDVMITHQIWKELMGGRGAQASIKELLNPKMVISGDFHQFKSVRLEREDGSKLMAVSPGSTYARRTNEPAQHYVVLLNSDCTLTKVRIGSRPRVHLHIDSEESFEAMFQELPAALDVASKYATDNKLPPEVSTPLLFVTDQSELRDIEKRLEPLINDQAHLFYSKQLVGLSGRNISDVVEMSADFDVPVADYAVEEAGGNKEAASLLSLCFSSGSPKEGVAKWREQFMQE